MKCVVCMHSQNVDRLERSTPIKLLRSLQHNNAITSNAITTLNLFIFMVLYPHSTISKSSPVDRDLSRSPNLSFKMKLHLKVVQQAQCT